MDGAPLLDEWKMVISDSFGKAQCEVGWAWRPPSLSDYDLWYVLSGKGMMRIGNKAYPLSAGSCFVFHPGDRPSATQHPEDRLKVIFIHFQCRRDERPISPALFPDRYVQIVETHYVETLLNRILELEERQALFKEQEFDFIIKQLLTIAHRVRQASGDSLLERKHKYLIMRVVQYMKENPGKRISHGELAAIANLSPVYLSKIFKKQMGISLKEFMVTVRLDRALYLLQESAMNVSQVAEALGYANIYLFSKQFKLRHGLPPSRFRNKRVPPSSHGS